MNPNESWIAEQARLLMLEDGFGPGYSTKPADNASVTLTVEANSSRSSSV